MAVRSEELGLVDAQIIRFPRRVARVTPRPVDFRRRRLAASTAALLVAIGLFMLATGPEGSALASRSGAPKVVSVQPGQSLWDLAERYSAPGQDPRAYVDALIEINQLGPILQIGQRVKLPH